MKELSPIIVFVYNRLEHTKNTIDALSKNELAKESELWIFSDNAKNEKDIEKVENVRTYIHLIEEQKLFKSVKIIEADKNKGLANSVIDGVTKVINNSNKVIVVEDDLITSKYFIKYMNEALDFYEKDEKIWSISGYNLPIKIHNDYKFDVYLGYRGCSWGWATWKDRWDTVDWKVKDYRSFKHNLFKRKKMNRGGPDMAQMLDAQMSNKCDSWAIRWCYSQSKQNKYTIYPVESLIINQGLDGSGTHSGNDRSFDVKMNLRIPKLEAELKIDKKISKSFYNKFYYGLKQKIKELIVIIELDKLLEVLRRN